MQSIGKFFQNSYLVADLDAALDHWVNVLGVGPFFTMDIDAVTEIEGEQRRLQMRQAHAYWNDINIELTVLLNDTRSHYTLFLDRGREGLEHIGVLTEDFAADEAKLLTAGFKCTMKSAFEGGRVGFYDTDRIFAGTQIELVEETDFYADLRRRLKAAADNWQGEDPVRPVTALYA